MFAQRNGRGKTTGDLQIKLTLEHEVWSGSRQRCCAADVRSICDTKSHSFADSLKPFILLLLIIISLLLFFFLYSASTAALWPNSITATSSAPCFEWKTWTATFVLQNLVADEVAVMEFGH